MLYLIHFCKKNHVDAKVNLTERLKLSVPRIVTNNLCSNILFNYLTRNP